MKRKKKRALSVLYGTPKPTKQQEPIVTFEELLAPRKEYEAKVKAYRTYKKQLAVYKWQAARYKAQKPYEPVPKAVIAVRTHRVPLCVSGALLVAAIVVLSVTLSVLGNIFRVPVIDKIQIGDTREQVISVLGKPYGYEEDSNDYVWEYYGKNYQKLLDRQEKLAAAGNFEDLLALEEKLQTTKHSYIEVRFTQQGEEITVSSVTFEPARLPADSEQKVAKSYKTISAEIVREQSLATVVYSVTYTDGSFYKLQTAAALEEGESSSQSVGSRVTVEWQDVYGNEYTAQAIIVTPPETPEA